MKCMVLLLDGLDYDLVEKWNLTYLMQEEHHKFKVPEKYYNRKVVPSVPYSPIIWSAFVSGLEPNKVGIDYWWTYGKILDKIRKLPVIRTIKNKRRFLSKIGIKRRLIDKKTLSVSQTLFEKITPSIAIDVPAYNPNSEVHRIMSDLVTIGDIEKCIQMIFNTLQQRKKKILNNLSREWKLFVAYFSLPDLLGHIAIVKKRTTLKRGYQILNEFVRTVKSMIRDDHIFLILSDHGMQVSSDGITGIHSDYAFWPLNRRTTWRPKDFLDVHKKIVEWAEMP